MDVDAVYEKVVGHPASDAERARLYRLRDSLGLSDNDAFWYILIILEHYDALYRDYPRQIAEHAAATLEGARRAFATAAAAESAKAQRTLAEKVAETSVVIARRLAERPIDLHRVTTLVATVVAFGAMCMAAGVEFGEGKVPWWTASTGDGRARQLLSAVLGAPAGWMIFALMVPGAFYGGRLGWHMARADDASPTARVLGWTLVVIAALGIAACAALLAKTLG
jgi:hypothetical protein